MGSGFGAHHGGWTARRPRGKSGLQESVGEVIKPVLFFRLAAESGEEISALDRVGGLLGDAQQFGEFRSIGAAGEEGVDQRRGDDAEAVQALSFLERLVMSGLLSAAMSGSRSSMRAISKSRVLGLKSVFLAAGPWP